MSSAGAPAGLARLTAARRLRERPLRTALTAAGVAAGVALLFSITLLNAQMSDVVDATGAVVKGPRLLQITAASPGGLPEALVARAASDPRVAGAAPILVERTTISAGGRKAGAFVIGVTADIATLAPDVVRGVTPASGGAARSGIVVSGALARRLRVPAEGGGQVEVEAPAARTDLPVAAVVSSPLLGRINGGMASVLPLPEAQQLFQRAQRVDQILVAAKPGTNMAALTTDLRRLADGVGIVGRPGAATGAASKDLASYLMATSAFGMLALCVAAVLVFNTMTMAAAEQRTEIALARSLGATRRQLMLAALSEAALLGAVGTIVGLLAGGLLARAVLPVADYAYRAVSPVDAPTHLHIRPGPLLASAAAGMIAAVVGAIVPARRAAKAAPIDALRPAGSYEWRDPARPARTVAVAVAGGLLFAAGAALAFRIGSTTPDATRTGLATVAMFSGLIMLLPTAVPLAASALAAFMGRMSRVTGRLAADALQVNPRRTSFTVAALALPLAIVVGGTMAFDAAITKFDRFAHTFIGAPLTVDADSFVGYTAPQPLAPADGTLLEGVPGVRAVLAYENAFIALPDHSDGVLYTTPLTAAARAGVSEMVNDAKLADNPADFRRGLAAGEIAASHLAARNLHLRAGSHVTLPTPTGPHTFTVAVLYEDWSMRSTFYLDHDTYTALWGDEGAARYAIVPAPGTSVAALRPRVQAAVSSVRMAAEVHTRDEAIRQTLAGLTNVVSLFRGVELATLLCAALALANTAFTAIAERRWLFGLQRALGMTRRQLTRSLALEALAIGLIGSVAGVAIGLGLGAVLTHTMAVVSASHLPHPIPWAALAASIGLGAAIATAATQYPRRAARRLSIIESLRYE